MPATNLQVQQFVDQRIRVRAEQIRALYESMNDDIASIGDVYDALEPVESATWSDVRIDGPPFLLTPSDVLGINSFLVGIRDAITNHGQYPVVLKACVRPIL
jgi:hypothetical protein